MRSTYIRYIYHGDVGGDSNKDWNEIDELNNVRDVRKFIVKL